MAKKIEKEEKVYDIEGLIKQNSDPKNRIVTMIKIKGVFKITKGLFSEETEDEEEAERIYNFNVNSSHV